MEFGVASSLDLTSSSRFPGRDSNQMIPEFAREQVG